MFLGSYLTDSEGVSINRAFSGEGRGGFVKVPQSLTVLYKSKRKNKYLETGLGAESCAELCRRVFVHSDLNSRILLLS